jgi:hypothetical protein
MSAEGWVRYLEDVFGNRPQTASGIVIALNKAWIVRTPALM